MTIQRLRIFAASPSDMATERAKVETAVMMLKPMADYLGIIIEVTDWHSVVPDVGRPEQIILDQLKPTTWDVFIGILWHRFGTPPSGKDAQTQREYLSGTEEEFKIAYRLWEQHGRPRIMIYRCTRSIPPDALDPDQFKRVKEFFAQFDVTKGNHPGLYQSFETTEDFERLLFNNLQKLLLEYGEQIKGRPIERQDIQALVPKLPDNLPRRAPFFGRGREMDTVLRALSPEDRTWGVLVDGIGGIGKTSLAVEAAYHSKEKNLFNAFIFVSAKQNILAPAGIREFTPVAHTLDDFFNETARVLGQTGITQLEGESKRRALVNALRALPTLVIYDNLETLTKDEQEAVADFLRELPQGCKAIITSRRRGGEGAVWLRLEKLEWDAARQIIYEEAKKDARLKYKLQRAGENRWKELYDETKGSPLALVHVLGLMRVRVSLTFDGALEMLRGSRDPDLQKFIFQEAHRELAANDQIALNALSFFVPSATFEAWVEVAQLSRNALETTIDRLSALSLVDILSGEERYALHPLTRNFVRDALLANARIGREMGMRFAEYWVNYANRFGGSKYGNHDRFEVEWLNLDAAAEWLWHAAAVQEGHVDDKYAARRLDELAGALCDTTGHLFFAGRWDESLRLSVRTYDVMCALTEWNTAGWRAYQASWIHFNRANIEEASCWADRCTDAWKRGGNVYEQAVAIRTQGALAVERRDYDAAEQLYKDALSIFRDLNSNAAVAIMLNDLGGLERERQRFKAAEQYSHEALDLAEMQDLKELKAGIPGNLGSLALDRKCWSEAKEWFEKQLSQAREIGRQDMIAAALLGLAHVYEGEGQNASALTLAQEALVIEERLHHRRLPLTRELIEKLKKNTYE